MARPRLPQKKAEVSGAAAHDPGRFRNRKAPKARPLGAPYANMSEAQKKVWAEMAEDMPWLNRGHRIIVRAGCVLAAKMDEDPGGVIGISAIQALSAILSKLGATPTDETKVSYAGDDDQDPNDQFFTRPN